LGISVLVLAAVTARYVFWKY